MGAPTHMTRLSSPRRPWNLGLFIGAALLTGTFAGAGCGNSVSALSKDGGAPGSAGATGTGGAGGAVVGKLGTTQCTDGIDNDGDGLIDAADPECTGSADNDEGSFGTGIPGDNMDACKQDCFFDGNSGMGDDGCQWQLQCDPLIKTGSCTYDPSYVAKHADLCSTTASQSQKCIDNCRKYVPNGCDCFGCCAIQGSATAVRLSSTCTEKDLGDPTKCSPCTQVTQCMKTCGRCELCVGKTTVPADCGYDGGTTPDASPPPADGGYGKPVCSEGVSCTTGVDTTCPTGYGCVTGCCLPIVQ